MAPPAPQNTSCHYHDGANNTFAALRIIAPVTGDLLYSEFFNGRDPSTWWMGAGSENYYELYNVTADYYMLENIYHSAPKELTGMLHETLHKVIDCKGSAECNTHLDFP
jgi:hypothetical protein